jgi:hypothetical protein
MIFIMPIIMQPIKKLKSIAPSNFPSLNIMIQIPEEMAALVYSRLPLALFSQAHSVSGET